MLIENETSRRDDTIEIEERDLIPIADATRDHAEERAPEAAIRTAEDQFMATSSDLVTIEHFTLADYDRADARSFSRQAGKIGWALLWLLGVPLPVLLVLYLIRGH